VYTAGLAYHVVCHRHTHMQVPLNEYEFPTHKVANVQVSRGGGEGICTPRVYDGYITACKALRTLP
jgi:hypothetical protein